MALTLVHLCGRSFILFQLFRFQSLESGGSKILPLKLVGPLNFFSAVQAVITRTFIRSSVPFADKGKHNSLRLLVQDATDSKIS